MSISGRFILLEHQTTPYLLYWLCYHISKLKRWYQAFPGAFVPSYHAGKMHWPNAGLCCQLTPSHGRNKHMETVSLLNEVSGGLLGYIPSRTFGHNRLPYISTSCSFCWSQGSSRRRLCSAQSPSNRIFDPSEAFWWACFPLVDLGTQY